MSCKHKWFVFSTAVGTGQLLLECAKCNALGTVDNPSDQEWEDAFFAPNHPYRWRDRERVNELEQEESEA